MIAAIALAAAAAAPSVGLGTLHFPVTGNADCQALFEKAMLQLHSFEYDDARATFQAASKADPRCPMARWGEAMTYSHPLWGQMDQKAAQKALAGAGDLAAATQKERDYFRAASALFSEPTPTARLSAWRREAVRMHEQYPDDDEVTLHAALALISDSALLRNTTRAMQAAALAQEVLTRQPNHPGAAHYLIHASDTPEHAALGLHAARVYARIAPQANHALHMPSHIFVQLGLWDDVVRSNEASFAASKAAQLRQKKPADDLDWHSAAWLHAAYLTLGRVHDADKLLADLGQRLQHNNAPDLRFAYALMLMMDQGETLRHERALHLVGPLAAPIALEPGEKPGSLGCALHAPGAAGETRPPFGLVSLRYAAQIEGRAAAVRADAPAVAAVTARSRVVDSAMKAWADLLPKQAYDREHLFAVFAAEAKARATKSPADSQAWVKAARAAAAEEEPGQGPAYGPCQQQQLGDALLFAGQPKEAVEAYDRSLELHPGLSRSLLGAARAAKAAGQHATARERYSQLLRQWHAADADLPELAEVRAGAQTLAAQP